MRISLHDAAPSTATGFGPISRRCGHAKLEAQGTSRATIAQRLFGVAATPTLLPQLDEIAKHVRPD